MERKREEQRIRDDTGKYQDPHLENEFMTALRDVYMALQEAGFEPFDQLTGYVRTGNEQYITRRHNARKIVTEMDPERIKRYLKRYGHMYAVRK